MKATLAAGLAVAGVLVALVAAQAAEPRAAGPTSADGPRAAGPQAAAQSLPAPANASAAAPPRAAIDLLEWLAGHWRNAQSEEVWLAPRGGLMLAMTRELRAAAAGAAAPQVSFEYLRIEQRDGTLVLQASPGGKPPTPFALTEIGPQRVRFSNLAHDFPQHIIYWREGAALRARVEGRFGGRAQAIDYSWNLAAPPAPAASAPAIP